MCIVTIVIYIVAWVISMFSVNYIHKPKSIDKRIFKKQWLQFDHLKPNHLFQVTLESHQLWNSPETDGIWKLCLEVLFQGYTQKKFLSSNATSNIITESQLTAIHSCWNNIFLTLCWKPYYIPMDFKWMSVTYDVSHRYSFLRKILVSLLFYKLSYRFLWNQSYFYSFSLTKILQRTY